MILIIPQTDTAMFAAGHVYMDVVRTDVDPDQHLGFQLRIEVNDHITEPA